MSTDHEDALDLARGEGYRMGMTNSLADWQEFVSGLPGAACWTEHGTADALRAEVTRLVMEASDRRDDEDRIGRLLDLAERNNRLLVALARDNGLDADGRPVDMPGEAFRLEMKGAP